MFPTIGFNSQTAHKNIWKREALPKKRKVIGQILCLSCLKRANQISLLLADWVCNRVRFPLDAPAATRYVSVELWSTRFQINSWQSQSGVEKNLQWMRKEEFLIHWRFVQFTEWENLQLLRRLPPSWAFPAAVTFLAFLSSWEPHTRTSDPKLTSYVNLYMSPCF